MRTVTTDSDRPKAILTFYATVGFTKRAPRINKRGW